MKTFVGFIENAVSWVSENIVYNSKIPRFIRIILTLTILIPITVFALRLVAGVAELAVRLISLAIVIVLMTMAVKIFGRFIKSIK